MTVLAALLAIGLTGAPVTFNRDIAPIIAAHCVECHHAGGPAPFSLTTFDEARRRASLIVETTGRGTMPPWMPEPAGSAEFERARRLGESEITLIKQWAADGFVEGDATASSILPTERTRWALGPPDLVVSAVPYQLPAEGDDVFRTFVARVPLTATRYVAAFEFDSATESAVHHANIKIDRTESSRLLDADDPEPGYEGAGGRGAVFPDGHFLGWTPGQSARRTAGALSWTLPPGADIVFELHMVPTGRPEQVHATIGLYFMDRAPQLSPVMIRLGRQDLEIPAGDGRYVSTDSFVLPIDATVMALQPHAHRLATDMEGWATLPDGSKQPLISIPRWDMRWQDTYVLKEPLRLPAGTQLSMRFAYDNSERNPRNDSPPRLITFGQTTRSEMGDLWIQVLPETAPARDRLVRDVSSKMLQDDIDGVETMLRSGVDDARLRTDLAFCYVEAGRLDAAVEQLRRAVALAPDSAAVHHDLATLLLRQRRYAEARTELDAAIRLRPGFHEAYINRGVADFAEGRREGAIGWYERGLQIEPSNGTGHYNLAVALEAAGDVERARAHYDRAIALAPDDAAAWLGRARLAALHEAPAAAMRMYREALRLEPESRAVRMDLAWLLATYPEKPGDTDEAIALATGAVDVTAADLPTALDVLATAYAADGQKSAAVETARRALAAAVEYNSPRPLRDAIARRLAGYEALAAATPAR